MHESFSILVATSKHIKMSVYLKIVILLIIVHFQAFAQTQPLSLIQVSNMAQEAAFANVTIVFPYQGKEAVKVGIYENTLIEEQFRIITDTISNEQGELNIKVPLNTPTILISKSIHGTFRFYIVPEETLTIYIYNEKNIKFEGTSTSTL